MAISTLQTDATNDLQVTNNNLVLLSGADALAQSCKQATQMRLGENIFLTTQGVDYFGAAFAGVPDVDKFKGDITDAINNISNDVTGVADVSVTQVEGDQLSFTASILSIYGTVNL